VEDDAGLLERVRLIHERIKTDAIVEEYIDGREVYVGVMGNHRLSVLPVWELELAGLPADSPRIATRRLKIDPGYQRRHGVDIGPAAGVDQETQRLFDRTSRRIYRLLGLSGYARLDYRWTADGKIYFLEANPNPEIAADEEFAASAVATGMDFDAMIQRFLRLGIARFEGTGA
jgi:D-alanine-D-alanine ligase